MKRFILIIFSFITFFSAGNTQSKNNWEVEVFYGYQKNDKRFFGNSETNDDNWGVNQYGLQFNRTVFQFS